MSLSDEYENAVLDMLFGGTGSAPGLLYVAACTDTPTNSTLGTEPAGADGYARVEVDNDLVTWSVAAGGSKDNSIDIEFPEATDDWGTIVGFMIMDDATGTDPANVVAFGNLGTPKVVNSGDIPRFPIGSFTITAD